MASVVIGTHVRMLGLNASGHGVTRTADHLATLTYIAGRAWEVSGVIGSHGSGGFSDAIVVEAKVLGALVGTGYGGDSVHPAGIIGDLCARCGHFGETASLVGILTDHFGSVAVV